jgi:hypothetical protein
MNSGDQLNKPKDGQHVTLEPLSVETVKTDSNSDLRSPPMPMPMSKPKESSSLDISGRPKLSRNLLNNNNNNTTSIIGMKKHPTLSPPPKVDSSTIQKLFGKRSPPPHVLLRSPRASNVEEDGKRMGRPTKDILSLLDEKTGFRPSMNWQESTDLDRIQPIDPTVVDLLDIKELPPFETPSQVEEALQYMEGIEEPSRLDHPAFDDMESEDQNPPSNDGIKWDEPMELVKKRTAQLKMTSIASQVWRSRGGNRYSII